MPLYDLWGHTGVDIEIPEEVFPDKEWLDEKDELFDHPEHGFFESTYKQKKLHYRRNLPKDEKPKAIVIWQHGILGQSGFGMQCSDKRYTDVCLRSRLMNSAGIAVYAHDQLGHGFSEGTRFYIPRGDWTINRDDYVKFARFVASQHEPGTPIFLCGDSYGGCLTIHAAKVLHDAKDEAVALKGVLLNCPAIHCDLPPKLVTWVLQYGFAPFFPQWTPFFMPHPITSDRVWKQKEPREYFTDQSEMRGLSQGGVKFRLGTALGMLLAMQSVQRDVIPTFEVPFHINHGTEDHGVPITGSEYMVATAKTPRELQEFNRIEGGYHGLFSEADAPKFLESQLQFIEKIIAT